MSVRVKTKKLPGRLSVDHTESKGKQDSEGEKKIKFTWLSFNCSLYI